MSFIRSLCLFSLLFLGCSLYSVSAVNITVTMYGVYVINTFDSSSTMDVTIYNEKYGFTYTRNQIPTGNVTYFEKVGLPGNTFTVTVTEHGTTRTTTSAPIMVKANSGENVAIITSSTNKQTIQVATANPSAFAVGSSSYRWVFGNYAVDLSGANATVEGLPAIQASGQTLDYQENSAFISDATVDNEIVMWTGFAFNTSSQTQSFIQVPFLDQAGVDAWRVSNPPSNPANVTQYVIIYGSIGGQNRGEGYKPLFARCFPAGALVTFDNETVPIISSSTGPAGGAGFSTYSVISPLALLITAFAALIATRM